MATYLKLTLLLISIGLLVGCAEQPQTAPHSAGWPNPRRIQNVRTTAYARGEDGGRHNAIGAKLCKGKCCSAASDWSRFPRGTRFRIVGTKDEYIIDDYGTALIGTIETYLIYRLTGGEVFATDQTNASRTLLFDVHRLRWDEELCSLFDVPMTALGEIRVETQRER